MGIHIQVKSEAEDFFRILLWHGWKRIILILAFVLLILGSFIIYAANLKPKDPANDRRFNLYIPVIFVPLIIISSTYLGLRRRAKKLAAIAKETTVIFNHEGVESSNVLCSTQVKWEQYNKVIEISKDFIFFPQDNMFFGIPKHCFANDEQILEFKALLSLQLGNRARLKS